MIFQKLFESFSKNHADCYYIEIRRNDKCFCDSGKKYKQCHQGSLVKKRKMAYYQYDKQTGEREVVYIPIKKLRQGVYDIRSHEDINIPNFETEQTD